MNFKYLGSWIPYNLNDSFDVSSRIESPSEAMGVLILVLNASEVDTKSNFLSTWLFLSTYFFEDVNHGQSQNTY